MFAIQVVIVVVAGCVLGLNLWLRRRAAAGSADEFFAGVGALVTGGIVIGALPGLLWPEASGIRIAAAAATIVLNVVAIFALVQRQRAAGKPDGEV